MNTKIYAIVENVLRAAAFFFSVGGIGDCREAVPMPKELSGLKDCNILADRAYGTKGIREYLHGQSTEYTIPPKMNVEPSWTFCEEIYKLGNVVERFLIISKNSGVLRFGMTSAMIPSLFLY